MALTVVSRASRLAAFSLALTILGADLASAVDLPARSRVETGETLWQRCKDGPAATTEWESCRYFAAVAHEFVSITEFMTVGPASEKVCFPERYDQDVQVQIYFTYLRDHPEERALRAIELYYKAMREAYPCPAESLQKTLAVMPTKVGIFPSCCHLGQIPAFAGMTAKNLIASPGTALSLQGVIASCRCACSGPSSGQSALLAA